MERQLGRFFELRYLLYYGGKAHSRMERLRFGRTAADSQSFPGKPHSNCSKPDPALGVGKAGRQGLRLMDWSCGQTEDWTDSKWELGEEPPVTLPSVAGDGCWKGRDRGPIMLPP